MSTEQDYHFDFLFCCCCWDLLNKIQLKNKALVIFIMF